MNNIVRYESLDEVERLGEILAASGFFNDTNKISQAVVKVLAGRELGIAPIAAMTGINLIKGRVTLSANIMASVIKGSERYNYRVKTMTNECCIIEFYEDGKPIGQSSFSMNDAVKAGLANGDNWRKYPRNMLFARAMSNGAKWYCPDVFSGSAVYTPDELGAEVDGETGVIIEMPEHGPEIEPTVEAQPEPALEAIKVTNSKPKTSPNGNGKPKVTSQAVVKTKNHIEPFTELANAIPYYQNDEGGPDMFHILKAAGAAGFSAVTDDNIGDVIDAISQRYREEHINEIESDEAPEIDGYSLGLH